MNKAIVLVVGAVMTAIFIKPVNAFSIPAHTGFVIDQANILSVSTKERLETDLVAYKAKTSNEIDVLTVPSLDGASVEQVSSVIVRAWDLEKNNKSVLFLIALKDHKMHIAVGSGLITLLTNAEASEIQSDIAQPAFRKNAYDDGVDGVVQAMKNQLDARAPAKMQQDVRVKEGASQKIPTIPFWMRLGIFLVIACLVFFVTLRFVVGVEGIDSEIPAKCIGFNVPVDVIQQQ